MISVICLYIVGAKQRVVRDCSTSAIEDKCVNYPEAEGAAPSKICYVTCNYDGCNTAVNVSTQTLMSVIISTVASYFIISSITTS